MENNYNVYPLPSETTRGMAYFFNITCYADQLGKIISKQWDSYYKHIHKPVASGIVINHLSKTCYAFAPVMDSGKGKNKG